MKISVVGLGIMGGAMAKRLLEAGHELTVYNRTREKAEPLLASGAKWADSPAQAASQAEVVITMVTDPKAVLDVTHGDQGILAGISESAVHAEMSTVAPQSAKEIAGEYARRGRRFVQAPVLGSKVQIEQTALLVMAGGRSEDIDQCRGAWSAFAKRVWTMEQPEQASAMKLACNMLLGQMIVALGQSLTLAGKFGISPREFLEVVGESALAAPQYKAKGELILKGQYPPSFVVSNLLKDLTLGADAAQARGVDLPLNDVARDLFTQAIDAGYKDEDYAAVVKVLAKRAGVDLAEN